MNKSKWQPIETAPKDGSWIVAFYDKNNIPMFIFFDDDKKDWYQKHRIGEREFTHWMPLPEAP